MMRGLPGKEERESSPKKSPGRGRAPDERKLESGGNGRSARAIPWRRDAAVGDVVSVLKERRLQKTSGGAGEPSNGLILGDRE